MKKKLPLNFKEDVSGINDENIEQENAEITRTSKN